MLQFFRNSDRKSDDNIDNNVNNIENVYSKNDSESDFAQFNNNSPLVFVRAKDVKNNSHEIEEPDTKKQIKNPMNNLRENSADSSTGKTTKNSFELETDLIERTLVIDSNEFPEDIDSTITYRPASGKSDIAKQRNIADASSFMNSGYHFNDDTDDDSEERTTLGRKINSRESIGNHESEKNKSDSSNKFKQKKLKKSNSLFPEYDHEEKKEFFRGEILPVILWGLFILVSVVFAESVIKVYIFDKLLDIGFLYMVVFSGVYALFTVIVTFLLKEKLRKIIGFILLLLPIFWIMVQTVYYTVFSAFFTLYSLSGAKDVMEFSSSALLGIFHSLLPLLLCAIPLILYFILYRFIAGTKKIKFKTAGILLLAMIILWVGNIIFISADKDSEDAMTDEYVYFSSFVPQLTAERFGIWTTTRLDLRTMIFGTFDFGNGDGVTYEDDTQDKAAQIDYPDNVMEIDFASLIEQDTSSVLKDMDTYFSQVSPTAQNEYTGMFSGKNLVWICAEGFSTWALDEDLTPTLYKMSKECFVFNNFYNPIWGTSTSDGEYTLCTGLLPKTGVWSMSKSADNYMPFCLGNQFKALGYLTNAYHNHSYTYYDRDRSHPNMGYNFIAKGHGMENVVTQWPESDLEMMESTVKDFASSDAFSVYYMTVSGHLEYNFTGNAMAAKHKDEVADLPYSDSVKAYIACQMEFDQAVESLINQLEESGKLDDTLIVISGDHYPYGLTKDAINEVNGSDVDSEFELYHSTLIMWNSVLAQSDPVIIDKPCYSVDVLPTLSNLFGLDYDSRLLMGRDIFSNSAGLVVFSDHSWLTEKGRYNVKTGEFTAAEGVTVDDNYVQNMMDKVNSMFTYSTKILDNNYYEHIFNP